MKLTVKNYNLDLNFNKKIILLTDIHYYKKSDTKILKKIIKKISEIKCDYICISGDLIDQAKILDEDNLIEFLKKLASCAKVLFTQGNHDLSIKKNYYYNKNLFDKIKQITNLYVLENNYYIDNNIAFYGLVLDLDYYYKDKEDIYKLEEQINKTKVKFFKDKYNIVLLHTPIAITNSDLIAKYKIDLLLCGHVHAGLVPICLHPIFKGRGIISPTKKLFPKYAYGKIIKYNTNIIISSGITKLSHVNPFHHFQFLYSGEITVINI